jgi:hypothetical protein
MFTSSLLSSLLQDVASNKAAAKGRTFKNLFVILVPPFLNVLVAVIEMCAVATVGCVWSASHQKWSFHVQLDYFKIGFDVLFLRRSTNDFFNNFFHFCRNLLVNKKKQKSLADNSIKKATIHKGFVYIYEKR